MTRTPLNKAQEAFLRLVRRQVYVSVATDVGGFLSFWGWPPFFFICLFPKDSL